MRSLVVVAVGMLLLVCMSFADPSVKFPTGYVVPEGVPITGVMLYNSVSNSQNTLRIGVDVTKIATSPNEVHTLVGHSATNPSSFVIVPEALAPSEPSGALTDKTFPVTEMSLTLSTAVVMPATESLLNTLTDSNVRRISVRRAVTIADLHDSLKKCGVDVSDKIQDGKFTLYGATFAEKEMGDVLYASAIACSLDLVEQVTIIDLRTTYKYVTDHYDASSAEVESVKKMINAVIDFVGKNLSFLVAADGDFFANQQIPDPTFAVVPVNQTFDYVDPQPGRSSSSTGTFQIILWFTFGIIILISLVALFTCGVGIDIEKDTLLYQTTALRGQPVL